MSVINSLFECRGQTASCEARTLSQSGKAGTAIRLRVVPVTGSLSCRHPAASFPYLWIAWLDLWIARLAVGFPSGQPLPYPCRRRLGTYGAEKPHRLGVSHDD